MTEQAFYAAVYIWTGLALLVFPIMLKISAPYGRHTRPGWGPMLPNRWGWFWMEIPALVVFSVFFLIGPNRQNVVTWLFFGLWVLHYANRSLVYPLRIRHSSKGMPLVIVVLAFTFNSINGFINGYYFGTIAPAYPAHWMGNWRFVLGIALFAAGLGINWGSDRILIRLRSTAHGRYAIPRGGLFRWISCPNFLGEIVEWGGFALMVWSLPALSFFIWTTANLIPRARDHHRWYRAHFPDYPPQRRALV
jgi:steroid 5-alpha reductase family enzyme